MSNRQTEQLNRQLFALEPAFLPFSALTTIELLGLGQAWMGMILSSLESFSILSTDLVIVEFDEAYFTTVLSVKNLCSRYSSQDYLIEMADYFWCLE